MTNPFSTNELLKSASNYPVAKGDLPGHAFHGNQYVQIHGRASFDTTPLAGRAETLVSDASANGTDSSIVDEHRSIAEGHREIADTLNKKAESESGLSSEERAKLKDVAKLHTAADVAHEEAADAHVKAGKALDRDPEMNRVETQDAVNEAQNATDKAALFSANLDELMDRVTDEIMGNE